jgi:hypothetical protein
MVVAPHRDGGQAQFVDRPLPAEPADTLAEVTGWLERHLDQQVNVAELASLAHMSPRTFARRFVQETGTTPAAYRSTFRASERPCCPEGALHLPGTPRTPMALEPPRGADGAWPAPSR